MTSSLNIIEHSKTAEHEQPQASRALVLLHAFPLDARMWASAAEIIASELPELRVLSVNLPGAGGDKPSGEPSLDRAADDLYSTLLASDVTQAVVAGVSMGGYVALALAERHPDIVQALALIDTKAEADVEQARANRETVAAKVETQNSVESLKTMATSGLLGASSMQSGELADQIGQWIGDQSPQYAAWSQRAMAKRPDRTRILQEAEFPVAIIVGAEDILAPVEVATAMVDVCANASLTVVPRAGHLSPVEAPGIVAATLQDLVARSW